MSTPLQIPLEGFDHMGAHAGAGPSPFALLLGVPMFLFFLLLVAGSLFLMRRGGLDKPPFVRQHSPEAEAKRVLAERFTRGDISSDDFLERASVLNWTPGSEAYQTPKKKRR